MMRAAARLVAACAVVLVPTGAAAQLGPNGSPIRTSRYAVDLTQGPVLAGTRVTGLAGAYVAIGEGVDGMLQTPVSPAVRPSYSVDHLDYDFGLGLVFPSAIANNDFFNTGRGGTDLSRSDQTQLAFLTAAALVQSGVWGVGVSSELQRYGLVRTDATNTGAAAEELEGNFAVAHLQVARAFLDHQLYVGIGSRGTSLVVNEVAGQRRTDRFFATQGAGGEIGALYKPRGMPFRVGLVYRSEVTPDADPVKSGDVQTSGGDIVLRDPAAPGSDCATTPTANCLWLPREVTLPWDLHVGLAVQFGPRELNARWIDPSDARDPVERHLGWRRAQREHRRRVAVEETARAGGEPLTTEAAMVAEQQLEETLDALHLERAVRGTREGLKRREAERPRRYVLVSMSLLVQGPVENGVGVESFLQRTVDRSGQSVTFSPRLGVEAEPVSNWVKLRAGTYGEPSRFDNGAASARLHGTFGFDTKLFPWTVFGLFDDDSWWRASTALDVAAKYFGWGIGVGVWH